MSQKHSLWLVPPHPQRRALDDAIATFSAVTGLPPFIPHLTLLGDIPATAEHIATTLTPVAQAAPPLTVTLTGTRAGTDFFMSFYACAADNPVLAALHDRCARLLPGASLTRQFTPHISLAYGPAPDGAKRRFADTVAPLLPLTVTFDRVFIVQSSNDTPIENWSCLHSIPFDGAPYQ